MLKGSLLEISLLKIQHMEKNKRHVILVVIICHMCINKYMKIYGVMTVLELKALKESLIIHFDI